MLFRQDIHIHTRLSKCGAPEGIAADYIRLARAAGYSLIGFADHMWDKAVPGYSNWYDGQNLAHVLSLHHELAGIDKDGMEVRVGCECEYDAAHRDIAVTEEAALQLDFMLVPNSHTHMTYPGDREDREAHAAFMMQALWDILESKNAKYVTAIAHPFHAVCCPYPPAELLAYYSDEDFRRVFRAAAESGIAMEFNPCCTSGMGDDEDSMRAHPNFRMFRCMVESGCRFTYGSDRHTAVDYRRHEKTERFAALVGVTEDKILSLK